MRFSRLFHSCLFQIFHYVLWHLSCSGLLSECAVHTWKSTKLKTPCVCACVSLHACMQITQKDSFLLASLYSFWCLLWQISVRGDFLCWFIWGQLYDINILHVFRVACFLWLFKEILTWEGEMKWEWWFLSCSWSIFEIVKSFSCTWTVLKLLKQY